MDDTDTRLLRDIAEGVRHPNREIVFTDGKIQAGYAEYAEGVCLDFRLRDGLIKLRDDSALADLMPKGGKGSEEDRKKGEQLRRDSFLVESFVTRQRSVMSQSWSLAMLGFTK